MNKNKNVRISDTIHGNIQLSDIEKQIISTPIFNRLHNISQNSTAYLTFPTNRTKRFEHSVGTMYLSGKMFFYSIINADEDTLKNFFEHINLIINKRIEYILKNERKSYNHEIGDENLKKEKLMKYKEAKISENIYDKFIPINIPNDYRFVYTALFQAVRLSALLHDVGHPPFSHITENALIKIWNIIKDKTEKNNKEKHYYEAMSKYFNNKGDLHEQIGQIITERLMEVLIGAIPSNKQKDKEIYSYQLFKIFVKELTTAILQEKQSIFADIHRIIDGSLDCDRLDYVSRDALNSGFDSGKIEYERLISTMKLISIKDDNYLFCPSTKSIDTIEDFYNRRWKLYKQIVYHHRVIKTDFLLQNCIEEIALHYFEFEEEIEQENIILPYDISGLWKAIEDYPSNKEFSDSLIQWDDGWLMTILKKHYFLNYIDKDDINKYKLEELLANKKYYYSVNKKMEDFIGIDVSVANEISTQYHKVVSKMQEVKEYNKDKIQDSNKLLSINIDPFLNELNYLNECLKRYEKYPTEIDGFILAKIKNYLFTYFANDDFIKIVKDSVKEFVNVSSVIQDIIVEFKKVKTGLEDNSLALYNSKGNIEKFKNLSSEASILAYKRNFLPVFYLYVLKVDSEESFNYEEIKMEIGKSIGNKIIKLVIDYLERYKNVIKCNN